MKREEGSRRGRIGKGKEEEGEREPLVYSIRYTQQCGGIGACA